VGKREITHPVIRVIPEFLRQLRLVLNEAAKYCATEIVLLLLAKDTIRGGEAG